MQRSGIRENLAKIHISQSRIPVLRACIRATTSGRSTPRQRRVDSVAYFVPLVTLQVSPMPPMVTATFTVVLAADAAATCSCTRSPFDTVPLALPNAPPFFDQRAPLPLTAMGTARLMPPIVTLADVMVRPRRASATSAKAKAFGVVSATPVVLVKVSLTPPIISVVFTDVLADVADVCCTRTASPALTVAAPLVNAAPLML